MCSKKVLEKPCQWKETSFLAAQHLLCWALSRCPEEGRPRGPTQLTGNAAAPGVPPWVCPGKEQSEQTDSSQELAPCTGCTDVLRAPLSGSQRPPRATITPSPAAPSSVITKAFRLLEKALRRGRGEALAGLPCTVPLKRVCWACPLTLPGVPTAPNSASLILAAWPRASGIN